MLYWESVIDIRPMPDGLLLSSGEAVGVLHFEDLASVRLNADSSGGDVELFWFRNPFDGTTHETAGERFSERGYWPGEDFEATADAASQQYDRIMAAWFAWGERKLSAEASHDE